VAHGSTSSLRTQNQISPLLRRYRRHEIFLTGHVAVRGHVRTSPRIVLCHADRRHKASSLAAE
jgi:hypothetical protein